MNLAGYTKLVYIASIMQNHTDLWGVAEDLRQTRDVLASVEDRAAAAAMRVVLESVDRLSEVVERLYRMQASEWMDSEQAAAYLGANKSAEAFEKMALKEGVPRHHLSPRLIVYNRSELDGWLLSR